MSEQLTYSGAVLNLKIISTLDQLPSLDCDIPSLLCAPCVIDILPHLPFPVLVMDPYIKILVDRFLFTDDYCNTHLCTTIPYCHPLWLALKISNNIKTNRKIAYLYPNKHIHPIHEYSALRHKHQHNPIPNTY